jgi:hypothetical protein
MTDCVKLSAGNWNVCKHSDAPVELCFVCEQAEITINFADPTKLVVHFENREDVTLETTKAH